MFSTAKKNETTGLDMNGQSVKMSSRKAIATRINHLGKPQFVGSLRNTLRLSISGHPSGRCSAMSLCFSGQIVSFRRAFHWQNVVVGHKRCTFCKDVRLAWSQYRAQTNLPYTRSQAHRCICGGIPSKYACNVDGLPRRFSVVCDRHFVDFTNYHGRNRK